MQACFREGRVFLVGGPGGVGKTTLAAATGIALAEQGFRTIVLTVDPARRLAQALGFDGFQGEVQRVDIPGKPSAHLSATMLDTQRYFDRIIGRFATSEEQKLRILKNPMYQIMVESLGGSHEYAAMERLLEFVEDPQWEKIVVDTPPTDNAIDLLTAPQRLADFMDGSVIKWFQGGGSLYLKFFRAGTRLAMKALTAVFGSEFLDSLGKFFEDMDGMQAGFRSRHLEVLELLRGPKSHFFLVSFPSEARWLDSKEFAESLKKERIPLAEVWLNRIEKDPGPAPQKDWGLTQTAFTQYTQLWSQSSQEYRAEAKWVQEFKNLGPRAPRTIARQSVPLHDVAELSQLGQKLVF